MTHSAQEEVPVPTIDLIDHAIRVCENHRKSHTKAAFWTLIILALILGLLIYVIYSITVVSLSNLAVPEFNDSLTGEANTQNMDRAKTVLGAITQRQTITTYILLAISVVIFGVLMAVHRFHLQEIAKAEHFNLGFLRIKIAADRSPQGFESEVRLALVGDAFTFSKSSFTGSADKKVTSPLPGHPTSDVGAFVINKIIESFDIKAEPKTKA